MYLKVHIIQGQKIAAACDAELIGKVLRQGKICLDLEKFSSFYVGEQATEAQVASAIESATSVNLVGKKAVRVAIRSNIATKSEIVRIGKVPHLQLYRI